MSEYPRRIRLIVEYDGTNYVGWQVQPNGISVQECMENALFALTNERTRFQPSGRTDSSVHARAQVVHFDTRSRIPAEKFAFALNSRLPEDIRVKYSDEPSSDFHARFDVTRKCYRYVINYASHNSVFTRNTALHLHGRLDYDAMKLAATDIIGEHDFAAFKSEGTTITNTVRTIYASEWSTDRDYLYYDICGSGFMYNMVRILVGTMIDIGHHTLEQNAIKVALSSKSRADAGATAPAHGLTLMRVVYKDFDTESYV